MLQAISYMNISLGTAQGADCYVIRIKMWGLFLPPNLFWAVKHA
jgi:hypothetical protein